MKRRASKTVLKHLSKRGDLPCVGFEMDWVFFYSPCRGRWHYGNPRRLWGVPSEQERRADISEKEQRDENLS